MGWMCIQTPPPATQQPAGADEEEKAENDKNTD